MFEFPDEIEDLTKVPAEYRMLYSEEGKLLETAHGIRDAVLGLNKTVKNLRTEADRNKKNSNEVVTAVNTLLSEVGVDTVEALSEHIGTLNETIATRSKINPDKIRAEVEEGYKKQITDLNTSITEKDSLLKNTVLGRDVAEAVAKHRGNSDLLSPYVRSRLAMVEEGGKMHVRVTDQDGDYIGDGKGGWMTVETFVGSLKENPTYQGAFDARGGPGGSGTPPQGQQQPAGQQRQNQQAPLTPTQKIAAGLKQRGFGGHQRTAGAQTPPGME
jgi:hypothetical protein